MKRGKRKSKKVDYTENKNKVMTMIGANAAGISNKTVSFKRLPSNGLENKKSEKVDLLSIFVSKTEYLMIVMLT